MAEYRLSPEAQRDLDDIFDHTTATWGLAQALHYTDQLEAACQDLANAPYRAPSCDFIRPNYRRRGVEQHVIYCRPTDYGVAIVRILHQRMDALRHV